MKMMMFRQFITTGKSLKNKDNSHGIGGPEMKLKRAWPAVLIWVVFLIFIIAMVVSYSFFLGLFPSYNALEYSVAFMAISVLIMSVVTILLGKGCDAITDMGLMEKLPVKAICGVLTGLIIIGGFWYRIDILSRLSGDVSGKMSLYENAMIGASNVTPENDLLSIIYTGILRGILFFTGNIISVPFYFQTICFTVFLICGFFTVYKLLGMPGGLVFAGYVSFMPVFTPLFNGAELSTDSLFMAMFGIEFLLVALFLNGAYKGIYGSRIWAVWYVIVGLVVGYMSYVDAGTIIMILPFLLSCLFLKGRAFKDELLRLLILLAGSLAGFFAMIIQEAGIGMVDATLYNWGNYYFNNLNTFSTFWSYTNYKIIYLVTVVAMSGVIAGFWKNRKVDIVSPWLLSMLFIFATVPFMGATRMNTQVFVTAYYAFILACVAALIALPENEGAIADNTADSDEEAGSSESAEDKAADAFHNVVVPEHRPDDVSDKADMGDNDVSSGMAADDRIYEVSDEAVEVAGEPMDEATSPETFTEIEGPELEVVEESVRYEYAGAQKEEREVVEARAQAEEKIEETKAQAEESKEETKAQAEESKEETKAQEEGPKTEEASAGETDAKVQSSTPRFVPDGMILPEDDEDADMTPHMKLPVFKGMMPGSSGDEKLKIGKGAIRSFDQISAKDDFDLPFKPGDDFDLG